MSETTQVEATAVAKIYFKDAPTEKHDIIGHQISENWVQIITNNFVNRCWKAEDISRLTITQLENSQMVKDVTQSDPHEGSQH